MRGAGVVVCLERGADCLRMVWLMPLPSQNPTIYHQDTIAILWVQQGIICRVKGRRLIRLSLASFKSRLVYLSGTSWRLFWKHTHIYTCLMALCPGLPGWAGTRKVKPIWIFLKQETVSGSGITWASRKSASRSRQITTPAPHHSVFLQAGCLSCCPTNSV